MSDKDQIKDLFSEKLGNYEAKVNPDLWANVAAQVGTATGAAGTGGMSLLTKAIIGISGAAAITTGVVLYSNSEEAPKNDTPTQTVTTTPKEGPVKEDKVIEIQPVERSNDNTAVENSNTSIDGDVDQSGSNGSDVASSTGGSESSSEQGGVSVDVTVGTNTTGGENVQSGSGVQELTEEQGKQEVADARNNDMKVLEQEHLTNEDDPLNNVVVEDPVDEKEVITLEIPDVFTPDGNGFNDEYHLINPDGTEFKSFEFVIYDQFGKAVMMSKDPDFRWTGIDPVRGQTVAKGKYAYVLIAETAKGTSLKKTGMITVR